MMRARRDETDGDDVDNIDEEDDVVVRHRCSREVRCKYCDSNSLESCYCTPPCLRAGRMILIIIGKESQSDYEN